MKTEKRDKINRQDAEKSVEGWKAGRMGVGPNLPVFYPSILHLLCALCVSAVGFPLNLKDGDTHNANSRTAAVDSDGR